MHVDVNVHVHAYVHNRPGAQASMVLERIVWQRMIGCGGERAAAAAARVMAVAGWAAALAMDRAEATATSRPAVTRARAAAARVTAAAGWAAARAAATTVAAPARAGVIVAAVN